MARDRRFNPGDMPYNYNSITAGLLASGVIQSEGPVKLLRIMITNTNAAAQYIQLFDATAVPADGTKPDSIPLVVAGSSTASIDYGASYPYGGRLFLTGLCWSNSSTAATKTIGAADCAVEAQYL